MNIITKRIRNEPLFFTIVILFIVITIAKFLIAAELNLHWDESYSWQSGRRLAWAYIDRPFIGPLLVRLGTALLGDTALAVRLFSLVFGALIPVAVYLLARPIVERRDALLAAAIALVVPESALAGILSYHDAPLLLFGILGLAATERAMRTDRNIFWVLAGLLAAFGLATHYRFALSIVAVGLFLVLTKAGRKMWRRPGLYLSGGIAALGLAPIFIFNLQTDFSGFGYQLVERHPWSFDFRGLSYSLEQVLVVTPLLYTALIAALFAIVGRARRGESSHALLAIYSLVHIAVYYGLAPWSDRTNIGMHWPLPGYIPLFIMIPGVLRGFARRVVKDRGKGRARSFVALVTPMSGLVATAGVLVYLAIMAWPGALLFDAVARQPHQALMGWTQFAERSRAILRETQAPVIVAGNYKISAQLDFVLGGSHEIFVLDPPQTERHGLWAQYVLWGVGEAELHQRRHGTSVLLVLRDPHYLYHNPDAVRILSRLCGDFDQLRYRGEFESTGGHRYFRYFSGVVRPTQAVPTHHFLKGKPGSCPLLPTLYVAQPRRGSTVRGRHEGFGWIYNDGPWINAVRAMVDGKVVATAQLKEVGPPWSEVNPSNGEEVTARVYSFEWDSTAFEPGAHAFSIRVENKSGAVQEFGRRTIFIGR